MSKNQQDPVENVSIFDDLRKGDVVIFETDHGTIRTVYDSREKFSLWKTVAGVDQYYTIISALSVWINDKDEEDDAIGIAYHESLGKILLLDQSLNEKVQYRSRGISTERKVVNVTIERNSAEVAPV